ncbi:MAG: site-specific integrase, partial [Flavobacteriales bacterium]|nr:site-specific integrase [Flavobacteriales bacterium]
MKYDHNPAEVYLASLRSEQSRTGMRSLLRNTALFFDEDETVETFSWAKMTFPDVYEFLNDLLEDKKSPNTINTYLAAIKGVAREAWRLNLMSIENYHRIKDIKRVAGKRTETGRALSSDELNTMLDH